jgi:NADH:ubiquinone oxidoreductase subunit 2 (subunit N)
MLFFTFNLDSYFFYSILPELFIILFVLILILIAVTGKKEDKWDLLPFFLEVSGYFYIFLIMLLACLYNSNLFPDNLTIFYCYQTLKLNKILILMKILLSVFALGCVSTVKRYLMLYSLTGYEYPLLISLATLAMFLSLSANNWIILFLALELQALCFLVLFAWNRRSEKAINATLKFTVINFIASTLILIAIIEIILYTQTFNMYLANPYFFMKNIFGLTFFNNINESFGNNPLFIAWLLQKNYLEVDYFHNLQQLFYLLQQQNVPGNVLDQAFTMIWSNPAVFLQMQLTEGFTYNALWQFVGFLLVLGFAMKLGLVPFGFWLQDLYTSISLPVLTFFSTAPKLTYVTILLSLYINLFMFINPTSFLTPMIMLGAVTMIIGNCLMFTARNNLLILLAWSSVANMGLLFLLFGKYPLSAFTFSFIIYYTIGTFVFFLMLQYFIIMDETGIVRHPIYFADLSVVRYHVSYKLVFILLVFSFLNSFGIPPLLGFWMKFSALQGLVINLFTFMDWFFILSVVLMTIIGGFGYIRVLYTLISENNQLGLQLLYWPNTKNDTFIAAIWFTVSQMLAFVCYMNLNDLINVNLLLTQTIFIAH